MIQINLIPTDEVKAGHRKRSGRANAEPSNPAGTMVFLLGVVVMAGVGATGWKAWSGVSEVKARAERLKIEKAALDLEIEEFADQAEDIRRLREVFNNQWEVLQSLDPPRRVLWSEKINMLSALMPPNVFLTQLNVEERVSQVEIESSRLAREAWEKNGRKGEKPESVMKPVITYEFEITGLASGADNVEQIDNVRKFHDTMIAYETVNAHGEKVGFMDNLSPDIVFGDIGATLYEGSPVNSFVFKLKTVPAVEEDASSAMDHARADGGSRPRG